MPHATDRHPGSFDALAPLVLHQAFDAPMGLGNTAHTHTHTHAYRLPTYRSVTNRDLVEGGWDICFCGASDVRY